MVHTMHATYRAAGSHERAHVACLCGCVVSKAVKGGVCNSGAGDVVRQKQQGSHGFQSSFQGLWLDVFTF